MTPRRGEDYTRVDEFSGELLFYHFCTRSAAEKQALSQFSKAQKKLQESDFFFFFFFSLVQLVFLRQSAGKFSTCELQGGFLPVVTQRKRLYLWPSDAFSLLYSNRMP